MKLLFWLSWLALMAGCGLGSGAAAAASVADFYKSTRLTLYIGSDPGSGYDLYAREVGRFIGRHLPGDPGVLPENMPGAGSMTLANFMFNQAPRDGSAIGEIQDATPLEPILGDRNARFTSSGFYWLGSANEQTNVCVSWAATGVKTLADVQRKEFTVGVVSSTSTEVVPNILNDLTGAKLKMIKGYPSTGEILLAMQRGEVGGLCGIGYDSVQSSMGDALRAGKIKVFVQVGPARDPSLPGVPFIYELLRNPADKSLLDFLVGRMVMGRPFLAPPNLPPGRAKALRRAFWDTMHDPGFLAETKRINMPIEPISGEDVQSLVERIEQTPPAVVRRAAAILGENQ
jgi:tripartite-type tricarboxylate transporter receptor subunit TctC